MNDKNYLLAIDNGTQSVRALLFDLQGNLLGKAGRRSWRPTTQRIRAGPNRTPSTTGRCSAGACRRLWDQVDIDRGLIRGVSLTTRRQR